MTPSAGGKNNVAWVAAFVTLLIGSNAITFNIGSRWTDNTINEINRRLTVIEASQQRMENNASQELLELRKEIQFRIETANTQHGEINRRLDYIEVKVGIR